MTATDDGLDIDVRGSGPLTAALTAALARIAAQHNLARLTRHGELIVQARAPTLRMGAATVPLPPAAFLQATAEGEAALSRARARRCAAGAKSIADLFAGVGPFALRLAAPHAIFAADDDEPALAALKRAAATTAGLKPVTTERRDLFKNPLVHSRTRPLRCRRVRSAAPGRPGAVARACAEAECLSSSRCRAIRERLRATCGILIDGGYRLAAVTPVDQFRYSAHVEIVARLEK